MCYVNIHFGNEIYDNIRLFVMQNPVCDVILGQPFLKMQRVVSIEYGGPKDPLEFCALTKIETPPVRLFKNLTPNCHPIAAKPRFFNRSDTEFIESEVASLLENDVIEPSSSPWRAQVVLTTGENKKKRMVVDFSRTMNKFTFLDAYPLPRIDQIVREISKYAYYSVVDCTRAYYQVEIEQWSLRESIQPFKLVKIFTISSEFPWR